MAAPRGHQAYRGCETGGRPKKWTSQLIEQEADAFLQWITEKDNIWFEDFALQRGYDPNLLSLWANQNEKFSGVLKRVKAWQKSVLIKGGLLNKFNSNIVKLVLFNTSDWTDRQETKISGDATNPLAFILNSIDGSSKEFKNA